MKRTSCHLLSRLNYCYLVKSHENIQEQQSNDDSTSITDNIMIILISKKFE